MLGNINLADKTYEELMAQAIELIPLYSGEWTNYNPSDPGITVIENLSAFTMLQQSRVNEITEVIGQRLFELLGYKKDLCAPAKVFLKQEQGCGYSLIAGEKLIAGGMCFEVNEAIAADSWGIKAVYTEFEGVYKDITYLMENNARKGVNVFGNPARNCAAICCVFDKLPQHELLIYVKALGENRRNNFGDSDISFADVKWQCYTDCGWIDLQFTDETKGFLLSGMIRVKLPDDIVPARFEEVAEKGMAIRCVLADNCYDIPARIAGISVNLFEAVQKNTKAKSFIFHGAKNVVINHRMVKFGYFAVYARESKKDCYRAYRLFNPDLSGNEQNQSGRFYTLSTNDDGSVRFEFDKQRFGYCPGQGYGSVRVICYDDEMIHHYKLGKVEGYENQILDIEQQQVLPDEFCVLARAELDGEDGYYFVQPDGNNPDSLCYDVLPQKGQIRVREAGLVEECELFICDCVVTGGGDGNIIAGNRFTAYEESGGLVFVNPAAGFGGVSTQTNEQLRLRLLADLKNTACAVTAADYENLALGTPGLCIHKAKAAYNHSENKVTVAVKPYSPESSDSRCLAKLSQVHLKYISEYLNERRMITTKIELKQPVYVPIDVNATVYVKSYSGDARPEIEGYLREAIDGVSTDVPFGAVLSYHKLFAGVQALECTDSLYELSVAARDSLNAVTVGSDIQMSDTALYYAGNINLEIITKY
jgi:hypothetical protein